jgi:hypothetical protein
MQYKHYLEINYIYFPIFLWNLKIMNYPLHVGNIIAKFPNVGFATC